MNNVVDTPSFPRRPSGGDSSTGRELQRQQRDAQLFERTLRRLEEERREASSGEGAPEGMIPPRAPLPGPATGGPVAAGEVTGAPAGGGEAGGAATFPVLQKEGESGFTRHEEALLFEAMLESPPPQWLPPAGLEAAEIPTSAAAPATLRDFTALLEQGWHPLPAPGGERSWRFQIQDANLPPLRITLRSSGEGWSLALAFQGRERHSLAQEMARLQERLCERGNDVRRITFVEEE